MCVRCPCARVFSPVPWGASGPVDPFVHHQQRLEQYGIAGRWTSNGCNEAANVLEGHDVLPKLAKVLRAKNKKSVLSRGAQEAKYGLLVLCVLCFPPQFVFEGGGATAGFSRRSIIRYFEVADEVTWVIRRETESACILQPRGNARGLTARVDSGVWTGGSGSQSSIFCASGRSSRSVTWVETATLEGGENG